MLCTSVIIIITLIALVCCFSFLKPSVFVFDHWFGSCGEDMGLLARVGPVLYG